MSGSAFVFDYAKGRVAYYGTLPASTDALVWVALKTVQADATLRTYASLATLLAAGGGTANVESTFTGYSRKVQTTASVAVDTGAHSVAVDDTTDPAWSPTTSEAVVKIVCCYRAATADADSAILPLFGDTFDIPATPTSGTITYQVASGGFFSAS